ncbi:MAG: MarR family transcriptional regulator [Anaerolineae bacterium]|nr:MarR family transcriptional regulator [Anaerolineae bacterium]
MSLNHPSESEELAQRFFKVFEESFKMVGQLYRPPPQMRTLSVNQFRAMHCLMHEPGLSQKDLAERLEVTPAAVSTTVREMEKLDLIQRLPDAEDARLMRLHLSAESKAVLQQMHQQRLQGVVQLMSPLPIDEQRYIVEALERALEQLRHDRTANSAQP